MNALLHVAVATPAHSALGGLLSYTHSAPLPAGTLVRVPLGAREVLGVGWGEAAGGEPVDPARLRPIGTVLDALAPLGADWRRLVDFAARYYQRAVGELALAALPPALRDLDAVQLARRLKRQDKALNSAAPHQRPMPQLLPRT